MLTEDLRPASDINDLISLSGRVLIFGENQAERNTPLSVWALDERGRRQTLVNQIFIDDEGHFKLDDLSAQVSYEFAVNDRDDDPSDDRPKVHYFSVPLERNDPLV